MQLAGQIVGQRPHATHLGRPSACVAMTCVPRQRGDSSGFSSGYSSVTFFGLIMCLNVIIIPLRLARRYDVLLSGRRTVFTPIAIIPPDAAHAARCCVSACPE